MGMSGAILAAGLGAQAAGQSEPLPRAMIVTEYGPVTVELDHVRAPVTACNFMRYVSLGLYTGGRFFRSVQGPIHVVQAETIHGSDDPGLGPIRPEPARDTGPSHSPRAPSV